MQVQTEKDKILLAVKSLPDDAGIEDAIDQLYLLYKIDRGVKQLDAGEGIPHDEARRRFREWLD